MGYFLFGLLVLGVGIWLYHKHWNKPSGWQAPKKSPKNKPPGSGPGDGTQIN